MFGRKCDAIPLLNASKHYSTYPTEQSSGDESIASDPQSDPYVNQIDDINGAGEEMAIIRQENESEARLNIKIEQTRQKRIYDKKVKTNRY